MAPVYFYSLGVRNPTLGFLSQWYDGPFHTGDNTIVYSTAEQYMMHQKAILFGDEATAAAIMETREPGKQKKLGRLVKNFNEDEWRRNRERIVEEGSYHKFAHSLVEEEDLKAKLLATGDGELVEASPRDRIWGIGFSEQNATQNRHSWGLNLLGKALVRARERIRKEDTERAANEANTQEGTG